jgi:heavy metal translocating P-type ATPase
VAGRAAILARAPLPQPGRGVPDRGRPRTWPPGPPEGATRLSPPVRGRATLEPTEQEAVRLAGLSPRAAAAFERARLPTVAALGALGGLVWLAGQEVVSAALFAAATLVALVPATWASVRSLWRREATVDVIAALAMAGALVLGEWLAGAIIALMLTGGEALETRAAGRARRELTTLLARAPRTAHRLGPDGAIAEVAVDEVILGDRLLVKGGEVVPTDGLLLSSHAILDESALTGEAAPVTAGAGAVLRSGVLNAGGLLELRVTAPASASTYAGILRLVERAATERAPFVRLADRAAGLFVVATLVLSAAAWVVSGDPIRALAVLVVATPCPLILAAPAAIVGGLSVAARHGIIVKGGAALESLARGEVVLLDKTGTITTGRPSIAEVHVVDDLDVAELLRLAASLEQVSVHPFAPVIVASAVSRGLELAVPADVEEELGSGIAGTVDGRKVRIGLLSFVADGAARPAALRRMRRRAVLEGASTVTIGVDGHIVGGLVLRDRIRADTPGALRDLRAAGIRDVLMVTGDRAEVADLVGEAVGVDRVLAERAPDEKVEAVREAAALGHTIMVGDGINDAPALALADVGVAMGARGATAASEAADVVLTADRLGGLADAVRIARRTRAIAWQSVLVGMGLSMVAMVVAAAGYLTPVAGALLQEGIDLAVILNALRAVRTPGRWQRARRPVAVVPERVLADHRQLTPVVAELATLAEQLEHLPAAPALTEVRRLEAFLRDELLPHEIEEEERVYPLVADVTPGEDPTGPLRRSHREIARLIRLYTRLVDDLPDEGPDREDVLDLQRSLWGLHAVLDLHLLLEDELYSGLTTSASTPGS